MDTSMLCRNFEWYNAQETSQWHNNQECFYPVVVPSSNISFDYSIAELHAPDEERNTRNIAKKVDPKYYHQKGVNVFSLEFQIYLHQ